MSPACRIAVIGVGNPYRGDDAVGQVVTQHLRQALAACHHVRVLEASGDSSQLLSAWQDVDLAIVVDAVQSGAPAGTVYRLDARQQPLAGAQWRCSTHAFGVAEAIALARELQQLPPHLILYGIAGRVFAPGAPLSRAVAQAVPVVVAWIQQEIVEFQSVSAVRCGDA